MSEHGSTNFGSKNLLSVPGAVPHAARGQVYGSNRSMHGSKHFLSVESHSPVAQEPLFSSTHTLTWSGSQCHINLLNRGTQDPGASGKSLEELTAFKAGRVTAPLAITAAVTAFGSSFPHGWNTGVLNAPSQLIKDFINGSYADHYGPMQGEGMLNLLWALSVAIYLVGGCAGAFSAGWIADHFGRKKGLLVCHVFGFVSAVLFGTCKVANSFEMLIIARLIVGFGCGAGSGLVPMYLTEIAPVNIRGAMGVLHQFALTCGILFSQIFGLREILGTENLWPILLALTAMPCVVSAVVLPFYPGSPRYLLVNKGNEHDAEEALKRFRGTDDVKADIDEMRREYEQQKKEPKWSFGQLLRSKDLRLPLLLVTCLAVAQQLSGINIVFYYSTGVFEASGIPPSKTQYAVLGTGIINVLMTGISVPLMEKSGRRPLLLGGMGLMVIAASTITVALNLQHTVHWMSYVSIICVIAFVIGFAIGLGSIPQFIGAELFKQGPRPPAMSLAGLLNWLANFLVGIAFPSIQAAMKAYSFLMFIIMEVLFAFFIWWKLPETKNKTYDEIYDFFTTATDEEKKHGDQQNRQLGDRLARHSLKRKEEDAALITPDAKENSRTPTKSPSTVTETSFIANGEVSAGVEEEGTTLLTKDTNNVHV